VRVWSTDVLSVEWGTLETKPLREPTNRWTRISALSAGERANYGWAVRLF